MADDATKSLITKVFTILESVADNSHGSISLVELSRQTALPKSTVHRIAARLVESGFLHKTGTGFQLGMHLFELGGRVPFQARLRDEADPFIEDLHQATRGTIHLGVLVETDVMCIAKTRGHDPLPIPSRQGARVPAHCVASGKAILAYSPPEVVQLVLATGLPKVGRYTQTVPKLFLESLQEARTTGVAFEREGMFPGVCCVAAPIFDQQGNCQAAISVSTMSSTDLERYVPAVRTAAMGISRRLGHRNGVGRGLAAHSAN